MKKTAKDKAETSIRSKAMINRLFERYATKLQALPHVVAQYSENGNEQKWVFNSTALNSLPVTLMHVSAMEGMRNNWDESQDSNAVGSAVIIDIERVDCFEWQQLSFFHYNSRENLDLEIQLAEAALKGDVAYNKTRVLRHIEICFNVNGAWQCVPEFPGHKSHYIKKRNNLRPPPSKSAA